MSNERRSSENRQILEEASQWFVNFRQKPLDKTQRDEFMRWLKRSPEHIRAYMEIGSAYAKLPGSAEVPSADIERLIATTKARTTVLPLSGKFDAHRRPVAMESMPIVRTRRFSRTRLAAAWSAVGICAALAAWLALSRDPVYATQIAERRTITLEDGSKVELNASSKVRIAFNDAQRAVDLLEGQALFRVAKQANRPFVVRSAGAQIRAVGTQFDVHRKRSGTTVTVLEGRVAVIDPDEGRDVASGPRGTEARPLFLVACEQAVITPTAIDKPERPNISVATAWRQGEFEFDETALAEVVEEFNRHSRRALVIESASLADFRISGVYSSEDPSSLIRFLRNQPEFVVIETEQDIRIRRK